MEKVPEDAAHDPTRELDGLKERHRDLEKRLAALDRHLSLTTAEQSERVRLKKEKLQLKDRIQILTSALGQAP
jgi:uncharacterized protein YdcH (DUF465 family)